MGVAIRERTSHLARIATIGITVVGGSLVLGAQNGDLQPLVIVFLPFSLGWAYLYSLLMIHEINAMGGYRRHLEERLNQLVGQVTVAWESQVAPRTVHRSVANVSLNIVYAILSIVVGWAAWVELGAYPAPSYARVLLKIGLVTLGVMLVLATAQATRANAPAYRAAGGQHESEKDEMGK
jgi:hypothetical protein